MITVSELINQLQKEDGKRIVIVQKDSEENGYSPLSSLWTGSYEAYSAWSGDVGLEKLTEELKSNDYSEEDILHGEPALILTPVQ